MKKDTSRHSELVSESISSSNNKKSGAIFNRFFLLQTILLFVAVTSSVAQINPLNGKIVDDHDNPIAGANIYIEGTLLGAASDKDGYFEIKSIPVQKFILIISVIGFSEFKIEIDLQNNPEPNLGTIKLETSPLPTQPIITTASKYEQNVRDIPVSIANVSAAEINDRNAITIADALKYTSGINLTDDQVNIRGSSGYSRGVGSRVMMLVDGVPFIAGDTQGLVFEALAINEIADIEIIKGSGSALYGSSAMGGVVNVLTKPITQEAQYSFKIYGGMYSDPYYKKWKWTDKTQTLNGIKASFSKKFDKLGFRIGASRDQDDSYKQNNWKERINVGGKIQYDLSAYERITVAGNYMDQKRGSFLYWKDLQHALSVPDSQRNDNVHSIRTYLRAEYQNIISKNNFYKGNILWYHNYFDDLVGGEKHNSTSEFVYGEFQYNQKIGKHFITIGLNPTLSSVSSNLFGNHQGIGAALFIQDETKWSQDWITTTGLRYDYSDIDEIGSDQRINPKFGLVWKGLPGGVIRFSTGTGFRAPSMAEAFTSTSTGGIIVIPNENLKPERSTSAEIGWNQIFSEYLATDVAIFYNYYWDLIEGGFIPSGQIQFQNVTEARISGFELNFFGRLIPQLLSYRIGYTYSDTRDIELDDFLTYRPRHLLYGTLNSKWHFLNFGADYRFISRYDRIDDTFALIIADATERVDAHVVDVRISAGFDFGALPLKMSLQANNVLQYNYIDLVGSIAPIRQFVLALETTF
ncbi:MAG: TonB-dependent receptor [Calditrichaeota bacterium]|nr:MAG: TonB-dependent receptor [Calditrichota bacterium]MBL1205386.1 TonB-dependent receptor [Calditrichota bacterium]NOG45215.1 TonB-dependent receptor [Calditrichota bacterium]